jgi:hypothetical protein
MIILDMDTVTIMFTALLRVVEEAFFGFPVRGKYLAQRE